MACVCLGLRLGLCQTWFVWSKYYTVLVLDIWFHNSTCTHNNICFLFELSKRLSRIVFDGIKHIHHQLITKDLSYQVFLAN